MEESGKKVSFLLKPTKLDKLASEATKSSLTDANSIKSCIKLEKIAEEIESTEKLVEENTCSYNENCSHTKEEMSENFTPLFNDSDSDFTLSSDSDNISKTEIPFYNKSLNGSTGLKYSMSFVHSQTVQDIMFQQNYMARQLLRKYFSSEDKLCQSKENKQCTIQKTESYSCNNSKIGLNGTIAHLIYTPTFTNFASHYEYWPVKCSKHIRFNRSEIYVLPRDRTCSVTKNLETLGLSFFPPCPYYSPYMKNISYEVNTYENLSETQSTLETETEYSLFRDISVSNISTTRSFKCSSGNSSFTGKFLNSKNQILYKNKSENLKNNLSYGDIDDNTFTSLSNCKNLFDIIEDKDVDYTEYCFDEVTDSSKFQLSINKNDYSIDDNEYRTWLEKYSSQNDIYSARRSETTANMVPNPSIASSHSDDDRLKNDFCNWIDSDKPNMFLHLKSDDFSITQIILYEHVVIVNFVLLLSGCINIGNLNQLSIQDRMLQFIFLIFCFIVFMFVKNCGILNILNNS